MIVSIVVSILYLVKLYKAKVAVLWWCYDTAGNNICSLQTSFTAGACCICLRKIPQDRNVLQWWTLQIVSWITFTEANCTSVASAIMFIQDHVIVPTPFQPLHSWTVQLNSCNTCAHVCMQLQNMWWNLCLAKIGSRKDSGIDLEVRCYSTELLHNTIFANWIFSSDHFNFINYMSFSCLRSAQQFDSMAGSPRISMIMATLLPLLVHSTTCSEHTTHYVKPTVRTPCPTDPCLTLRVCTTKSPRHRLLSLSATKAKKELTN